MTVHNDAQAGPAALGRSSRGKKIRAGIAASAALNAVLGGLKLAGKLPDNFDSYDVWMPAAVAANGTLLAVALLFREWMFALGVAISYLIGVGLFFVATALFVIASAAA